jgi:hypothetical protein
VILPIVVLVFAAAGAALLAYGIDPNWVQYHHGFQLILLTRRFEGPLVALTLAACIALFAITVAGKRRAWWLVGLAPVLALLAHRFAISSNEAFLVNAQPAFVTADRADFLKPNDWIVGLIDGPDPVAFPYASLYPRPLVVRSEEAEPMLLLWSPFANSATAFRIDRSIRPNELEVVAMPGNVMLAYNSRLGQFINGLTGKTPDGHDPTGIGAPIPTIKTTWQRWLAAHPTTLVMLPPAGAGQSPSQPVMPYFPMPPHSADVLNNAASDTTIALIRSDPPIAILDSDLDSVPANFTDPDIVLLRNPRTGAMAAFHRRVDEDLTPQFFPKAFRKLPRAIMTDTDSGSAWTADGHAIDGPLKGKALEPVPIEDGVYLNVARAWYANLKILTPEEIKSAS